MNKSRFLLTNYTVKPVALAVAMAALLSVNAHGQTNEQAPAWLDWSSDAPATQPERSAEVNPVEVEAEEIQVTATTDRSAELQELEFEDGQAELIQRIMTRIERLEQQVTHLRGTVSEQERTISQLQRAIDEPAPAAASINVAPQLEEIEGDVASTTTVVSELDESAQVEPEQPQTDQQAASGVTAQPEEAPISDQEQQALYNQAFEILTEGRYEEAIDAFEAVVDANPQGPWVSSALFWQGETYYVEQRRDEARAVYQQLIEKFPDNNRVADARLKLGYIAYDEQNFDQARIIFEQVVEEHPDHQAAGLAQQRLSRIERMH